MDFYNRQPIRNRERTLVILGGLGPPARRQRVDAEEGVRGAHISPSEVTWSWCEHTLFSIWFLGDGEGVLPHPP